MRILVAALLLFSESVSAETLVFGAGVHNLSKPVVINANDTSVEIQPGAILRGVDPIISIKGPVNNIRIHGGGTLEGGVHASGGVTNVLLEDFIVTLATNAVLIKGHMGGCKNLRITGLTIHNVGEGVVFRNCQDFFVFNNTISDMWAQDGIEPVNSQRGMISNNRVTNPGTNNSAIDVFVNYSTVPGELAEVSSVTISNNILTRTTPGFYASGINIDGNVVGANLRGNQIIGTYAWGIRLLKNPRNISITDHVFRNLNAGVAVGVVESLVIADSHFIDIARWSIITGTQMGPPAIVVNNQFSGDANHIVANASVAVDANTFSGIGWAIVNTANPVAIVTNNNFSGPNTIYKPDASNLFMENNTTGP
jgi:hypothetical protein